MRELMDGMLCDRCGDVASHFHEDYGNVCDTCANHWSEKAANPLKNRKSRPPSTEPAEGGYKWITPPVQGVGIIQISSKTKGGKVSEQYAYFEILHPDGSGLVGFRLRKEDGTQYDISIGEDGYGGRWECECPDAVYNDRPNTCKHCAGIRKGRSDLEAAQKHEPTHGEIQAAIDLQIEAAREFRKKHDKPPMTKAEESNFRDRLRQCYAR